MNQEELSPEEAQLMAEAQRIHDEGLFNLSTEYEGKVRPLVRQVNDLCRELGVQFVMFFVAAHGQDETQNGECHFSTEFLANVASNKAPEQVVLAAMAGDMRVDQAGFFINMIEQTTALLDAAQEQMEQESAARFN